MKYLISIIVPVYKAEKYIRKCLDSIIAQTHTNWEAILVDDGSPDNCGGICDEYAASDKRFKVIHQKNGGVSVARQTGLDNTTGDYIIHCDPDDWIEPTMLEELLAKAIEEDADMVMCDFFEWKNGCILYKKQFEDNEILNANVVLSKIVTHNSNCSLVNKLVKRSILNDIKFEPRHLSHGEDRLFNVRTLINNSNICISYLPKAFYYYKIDAKGSLTKARTIKTIRSGISTISEIELLIKQKNCFNLHSSKKEVLLYALLAREYNLLRTLYTEIHAQAIEEGRKYNFFTPRSSCLSIALKGYPRTAYYLYHTNMFAINIWQRLKHLYKKIKVGRTL